MSYENLRDPGPLFSIRKLARTEHPVESKLAAAEATKDGAITLARSAALAACWIEPGRTACEMERRDGVLGRAYGRRLGELEILNLVRRGASRRCNVTGRAAAVWYPVGPREGSDAKFEACEAEGQNGREQGRRLSP